ncbi:MULTISPECIES: Pycsar system effector family protein [unclassified Streptomyces]|uniref:Pycsar system effector family protein n=1 Tax=unclassified Streptomyces TaxID=2593676 RepID=UPI001371ED69|nr:Pycsar system effector family protein [Streptomyces sp. YIM 132580]MXG27629.1 hypothetical protein [Streptomyces sp. YIM 132580]
MPETDPQQQGTESAWRLHGVVTDLTGKADAKAAIVLSLESAVVTALTVQSGAWLPTGTGLGAAVLASCYWAGVGLLIVSAAACVLAILPRLDGAGSARRWREDYLFFGHLRHWDPSDLADTLRVHEVLPVLTRQLVDVSRICWRKHRLVQLSIALACGGAVLAAVGTVAS